jgi:uncharacterized protein YhfF
MPIQDGRLRFGYDGDRGVGRRLIGEVLAGTKTATCMPLLEYPTDVLAETRASVGRRIAVVDGAGIEHCQVRVIAVYETPSHDLAPRMLRGEGYGTDTQAFLGEHVAERADWAPLGSSVPDPALAAHLPLDLMATLWLYDVAGLSLAEIAQVTGADERDVRARVRRARVQAAHPTGTEPITCRAVRAASASAGTAEVRQHRAECKDCQGAMQRLAAARRGERPATYQSLSEELALEAAQGSPAVLNTVFVVTEFELA